jgi:hypothetical protein
MVTVLPLLAAPDRPATPRFAAPIQSDFATPAHPSSPEPPITSLCPSLPASLQRLLSTGPDPVADSRAPADV